MFQYCKKIILVTLTLCLSAHSLAAQSSPILTVEANGTVASYTFEDLSSLPQVDVVTTNNYVDGMATFTGPTLRSVLEQNGIGPDDDILLHALNDFFTVAPASDAYNYDVILAILKNDQRMPIREQGPIWVIYPMDDHAELLDDIYNVRLVWQLNKIIQQ